MNGESDKSYEVGRGKPPLATRWKKGMSGNPTGRRKKEPPEHDPGSIIEAIDNEEIEINFNGKRQRMKLAEYEIRLLFAKGIKADLSAARLVVDLAAEHLAPEIQGAHQYEFLGVTEAKRRFGPNYLKQIQKLNISAGYRT
jgi:hypothetical protein